ncbi:hypothetical protein H0H92_009764 [Tricholoma furcatifolium]|nr:hypothetical protein H0H92_009764 [Tricholoma furcatifolium]
MAFGKDIPVSPMDIVVSLPMRRRLSKKQLLSGPPPTPSYTPSAGPSRPKYNFAKKQKKLPALVFVSYGQSLLQKTYLPEPSASRPHRPPSPSQDQPQADKNPFLDVALMSPRFAQVHIPSKSMRTTVAQSAECLAALRSRIMDKGTALT